MRSEHETGPCAPTLLSSGSALMAAGGSSFEQAVKDVTDKQSLSVGECKFVVIVSSSKRTATVTLTLPSFLLCSL